MVDAQIARVLVEQTVEIVSVLAQPQGQRLAQTARQALHVFEVFLHVGAKEGITCRPLIEAIYGAPCVE